MNRHERRRAEKMSRENKFVRDYVRHLPEVPVNAPLERGRVYHAVYYHEEWCGIYDAPGLSLGACTCTPEVRRFAEPTRL